MIKRYLIKDIKGHLQKKEITMIVGPRQSGKTTLMRQIENELISRGEKTLFLNLDIEEDRRFFGSQSILLSKIRLEMGNKKGYVFIDEIQRKHDAGVFLKGIYDMGLPYKFIVSGSGSMELKEAINESLAGRKQVFELNTVSIYEFIDFKTGYRFEDRLAEFFEVETGKTQDYLLEYLNFGGYPRVILEDELIQKRRVMDEIYRSYIERDISVFLKVEKIESFSMLIKTLASQIGGLVNLNELTTTVAISLPTAKNYLWYAEKTFVLQKVSPFYRNIRKEIVKSPIYYFYDIGLRNYAIGMFGHMSLNEQFGYPFENLIFNILKTKTSFTGGNIHFWRTKDKAEVDFVIDYTSRQIPIEVKYKKLKEPEVSRSLISFIKQYKPKEAFVINLSLKAQREIERTNVKFIPWWQILEINF